MIEFDLIFIVDIDKTYIIQNLKIFYIHVHNNKKINKYFRDISIYEKKYILSVAVKSFQLMLVICL
jgi:hypothetical protein